MALKLFLVGLLDKKMVIWKERKHELNDATATRNSSCVDSLRGCELLKLFKTLGMISHPCLLEYIL